MVRRNLAVALAAVLMAAAPGFGDMVPVRFLEGEVHGFLALKTLSGTVLAEGDQTQVFRNGLVTSTLTFHFRDGSSYVETAEFTQNKEFRLVRYRLVEKGAAFKRQMNMSVDCKTGQVEIRYTEEHGKPETITQKIELPADLANGLVPTLLKNLPSNGGAATWSMLVATPKPRLIKLVISTDGEQAFSTGTVSRKARHYVVKADIGGLTGVFAKLVGKQPPDTHVWILGGAAPAFVRSEGPLDAEMAPTRIDLATPVSGR